MRTVTLELPDHVAHRLEICAAKDNLRLGEGIENLLAHMTRRFDIQRRWNIRKKEKRKC